jgi:hypothetical protein
MATNKIKCPECGEMIDLVEKQGDPYRLVAFHACQGKARRQVYETDAPAWPPRTLDDRLQQSEYPSKKGKIK